MRANTTSSQAKRFLGSIQQYWVICLTGLLLLAGGLWMAKDAGVRTDLRQRRALAREIRNIASTISPDMVQALSFTAEDAEKPEFRQLSLHFQKYAETAGIRSLYTMGLRNGQLVFGPENLQPDDPYASAPGTAYQTPSDELFDVFKTGRADVMGPQTDEFGSFVSALAPVMQPRTGKVMMIVGIDVESAQWQSKIRKAQWLYFLSALIPLAVLSAGFMLTKLRRSRFRHAPTVTCALTMLTLTFGVAFLLRDNEKKNREEIFQALAQVKADFYSDKLQDIGYNLEQMSSFFEASEWISKEEFHVYSEILLQNNPVLASVWFPEVKAEQITAFEEEVRKSAFPDFSIDAAGSSDPVLFPALYIEPMKGHEKALGFNFYSGEVRSAAMDTAWQTGKICATDPVDLITRPGEQGIIILHPVHGKQQNGLAGIVLLPQLLISTHQGITDEESSGIAVSFYQLVAGQPPQLLACQRNDCAVQCWSDHRNGLFQITPVFTFSKTYSLLITPEPKWLAAYPLREGRAALLAGLLLTVLMTLITAVQTNRPIQLETMVQQRTAELQENQSRLHTLIETIPDLVWLKDTNGVYLSCNTAFEQFADAKESDIIGKTDYDFVDQDLADFFRENDRKAIANGVPSSNEEWLTFAGTGYRGLFETVKTPLHDANGQLVGVLGIARDITTRKKDAEQIRTQLEELNRWYQATLGRESRVLELKQEVNEILRKNGEPLRYNETSSIEQQDSPPA
jgi:PAS domain S-box-containing protein